jgi:hypothetical protein
LKRSTVEEDGGDCRTRGRNGQQIRVWMLSGREAPTNIEEVKRSGAAGGPAVGGDAARRRPRRLDREW